MTEKPDLEKLLEALIFPSVELEKLSSCEATWFLILQKHDKEFEENPTAENRAMRKLLFEEYLKNTTPESDPEVYIYVLSELASEMDYIQKHQEALDYAKRARDIGKRVLLSEPTADTLYTWGMLEHNVNVYKEKIDENKND